MADAAAPPAEVPPYTHQQILRVITGIMLCIFLASLDQTVIIPAVPAMATDLNGFGHLSWIVTAYLLTSTASTPILAKVSDLVGRRALLLPGIVLFIAASMACGFAQSMLQLIVARAVQGVGGAALFSMAQAAVADVVSPRERGRYQGYIASMWAISSIAGPVLGGWATDHLSWRWIFWVNLPIGLLAIVLCERALRMLRHHRRTVRIDWLGAFFLVAGVTSLLVMLSWGGVEMPWTSPVIAGLGLFGVAMLAGLFWQERRTPEPILPPRLFANGTFLSGVLIAFFTSLALFGGIFLLPIYFQLLLGFDAEASGYLVIPYLASTVIGALVAGRAARRLGRTKPLILGGLGGCVAGFAGLTLMGGGAPIGPLMVATGILGIGIGATMPSILVQVQNAAERRDVGAATGALLFLRSLGGAFGSTMTGALLMSRFNAGLYAAGLPEADLGALRGGGAVAALGQARAALGSGFVVAFGACMVLLLIAVAIAAWMKDMPLKSGGAPAQELAH